ncbi:hypothetical protein GDO78_023131 [Eleutherodactylus coqui]|uniref:Uncharacterized protein n=1 Tax=Eleutherodactylus coqui TaxID=57060 RepID=A0A8J6E726_ELECQ|nr:hypothetical protein GDO78_023131 [Eleutherodactylus coqui]
MDLPMGTIREDFPGGQRHRYPAVPTAMCRLPERGRSPILLPMARIHMQDQDQQYTNIPAFVVHLLHQ